jgi:hypothetical protein
MKFNVKMFLIIPSLVILLGLLYGEVKDFTAASSKNIESYMDVADPDISKLMASMNIQQLPKPTMPPDFNLLSVAEEQVNLSEHRGKVVLLSFWATW